MNIHAKIEEIQRQTHFSGTAHVKIQDKEHAIVSYGYSNKADELLNTSGTRYGIASGCKLFTAIAISQLVEEGKLSFDTLLSDCLDVPFPSFDKNITVHHLLTHTSGIPDYFDEETMSDFEELWVKNPMYHIRSPRDFLPLFQHGEMKFAPGERFHYNNAGYILLGLIVQQASGLSFTEYVATHLFKKAGMNESGYFSFDSLPARTALGYIENKDGTFRTNIYSLPVKGGSDGGAYITTHDMTRLWEALMNEKLLNTEHTKLLLTEHVQVKEGSGHGYGVWISKDGNEVKKYHVMGYDPGVSFHSAYYPAAQAIVTICSNHSDGAYDIYSGIEDEMLQEAKLER